MKLNFAMNSLFNPANSPVAIVVPNLESPGITAMACPHPIAIVSFNLLVNIYFSLLILSEAYG